MKIDKIESYLAGNGYVLQIHTDTGISGLGQTACWGYPEAVERVVRRFEQYLIGQNPLRIEHHWQYLYRMGPFRGNVLCGAISAVDIALWDILGQSLDTPVWQLLGGRRHEKMPAYASGGWASADQIGDQLLSYIDKGGFKAVKMRIGVADGEVRHSAKRVQAARKALGDDIDIMCDAHGTYTVSEAKRFCRMVEDYNIAWFEEPVTADDKKGLSEIRSFTDIPIATGENEATRFSFRDLAELRAADIFQPDLAICGGITEGSRIAAIASAYQIRLAPHLWGGALMFAAGLHLCAASPAAFIIEYSLGANPMLFELSPEAPECIDGYVEIPDRPGLGVTINNDFVEHYAVK